VISASAPHIYHSALLLSPQTSVVRKLYESYTRPLVRVVRGLPISWEPTVATSYHHDRVFMAVWSPCSRFIALTQITVVARPLRRSAVITKPAAAGTRLGHRSPPRLPVPPPGRSSVIVWAAGTLRGVISHRGVGAKADFRRLFVFFEKFCLHYEIP